MVKIGINGAAGRMGRRVVALALDDPDMVITAALESPESSHLGTDVGRLVGQSEIGVSVTTEATNPIDVLIDFSSPSGSDCILNYCLSRRIALVMATTGLEKSTISRLEKGSNEIPIVSAPNLSLAVNLTMKMTELAARALKNHSTGVDVEIIERHHRFKADSPSGTAFQFGKAVAEIMGQTESRHGREGNVGERPSHEIGYHAIRSGDDPGQHTILFGMLGETIELRVAATNRDCYANGALEAAKFLAHREPGLYTMYDVLGLETENGKM